MSGFWLTPAAPGTVAPAHLDKVRELHGVVRDWIERSAVAQKNDHLRANLPYVDLMFAFGFATLGDHPTANALVEAARKLLEGPIPEGGSPQADQAVTAAVVRNFLFRALRARIREETEGRPHVGPLPSDVSDELDQIRARSRGEPVNNPYKLAVYVIDRFREQLSIVEPEEQPDPYRDWTKRENAFQQGVYELWQTYDPNKLVRGTRELLREAESQKNPADARYRLLDNVLPRAGRAGEPFVLELVGLVPEVVVWLPPDLKEPQYLPYRQVHLLVRALRVVARYRHAEPILSLTSTFADVVRHLPADARLSVWRRGVSEFLGCLQDYGRREESRRLVTEWRESVFGNLSLEELRLRFAAKREDWLAALSGLQTLAGTWLWLKETALAEPIQSMVRQELLQRDGGRSQVFAYTELAKAYIAAARNCEIGKGLGALTELFREMAPTRITNTWNTAQYYSRFHLQLGEDTVFAACRLAMDNPVPAVVPA